MKMLVRIAFVFVLASLLLVPATAVAAEDTFTYNEVAKVGDALSKFPMRYAVVPSSQMPAYDPMAHYVPKDLAAGHLQPEVWINAKYGTLLNTDSAGKDVQFALLSAAVMAVMDSGTAGQSFKDLYDTAARHDAALAPEVADRYRERHDLANAMAQALTSDRFVMRVHIAVPEHGASLDLGKQQFFSTVMALMAPGAWQVVTNQRRSSQMPKYAPLAFYDGIDQGHVLIAVNGDALRVHSNPLNWHEAAQNPRLFRAYIEAFIMAACDLGLAGPDWKKKYADAAALDKRLPRGARDPFKNRHAFAAPLAAELYGTIEKPA